MSGYDNQNKSKLFHSAGIINISASLKLSFLDAGLFNGFLENVECVFHGFSEAWK